MYAPPIVAHFTFPSSLIFKKPTIKDSKNWRVNNPAQRKSSISLVSLSPIPRFSSPSFLSLSLSLIFVFSAPHFFFVNWIFHLEFESRVRVLRMGQQSLIYSFVARGTVILAEYTEFTGNFTSIASQCLQKLPATNNKFTYNCDGHTFNYLVENGFSTLSFYLTCSCSCSCSCS